jgi:hypothetical protein
VLAVEGVAVARSAVARGGEEALVRNDADGAWMSGRGSHEAENGIDEWPIAIEEGTASVDEMLQQGEDVREGSRVTGEWSERGLLQSVEICVVVLSSIHEQRCKLLCLIRRQVSDTQLRQAVARVATHHQQRRLRTQDRHIANGVSNVRAVRKCACLCGMRRGEQLLTCNDLLLAGDVQRGNSPDALAFCRRQVQQLFRSDALLQLQCFHRAADLFQCSSDSLVRLLASLPLLRRLQSVVGTLRACNWRVGDDSVSVLRFDARLVCSARAEWSMRTAPIEPSGAELADLLPVTASSRASASLRQSRTCTLACTGQRSID